MTKKDYILIASILEQKFSEVRGKNYEASIAVRSIVDRLATGFKDNNTRFQVDKFLTACGITK